MTQEEGRKGRQGRQCRKAKPAGTKPAKKKEKRLPYSNNGFFSFFFAVWLLRLKAKLGGATNLSEPIPQEERTATPAKR